RPSTRCSRSRSKMPARPAPARPTRRPPSGRPNSLRPAAHRRSPTSRHKPEAILEGWEQIPPLHLSPAVDSPRPPLVQFAFPESQFSRQHRRQLEGHAPSRTPAAPRFRLARSFRSTSNSSRGDKLFMTDKAKSAELILKLYDLRREAVMREARNWFFTFNPESVEQIQQ